MENATTVKKYTDKGGDKYHVQLWNLHPHYMMREGDVIKQADGEEKEDGYYKYYDHFDLVIKEGAFINGERKGIWTFYYPGTTDIKCTICYNPDKYPAQNTYYYPNSQICRIVLLKADQSTDMMCYDINGQIKTCDTNITMPMAQYDLVLYLKMNLNYPRQAHKKRIEGRVIVSFVVSKTGEPTNIKVVRGADESMNAEAVRVISMMPPWLPGTKSGDIIMVSYNQAITFKL